MNFHFDGKPATNIGELTTIIGEIAKEDDEVKAARLLDQYTEVLREQTDDPAVKADPKGTAEKNIGYLTGYLGRDTADKALGLFKVSHPFFGNKMPTDNGETALAAGIKMGEESR